MKKDSTRTGASLCSSMMPRSATTSWLNKFKLLALVLTTMLSVNAWAEEEVAYTIMFKCTGGDDGTTAVTSTNDIIASGSSYMTVSNSPAPVYIYQGAEDYGIKGGSSSKKGSITLTTTNSGKVKPSKIVIRASLWASNETTKVLYASVNGGSNNTLNLEWDWTNFEIEMDGQTTLNTLKLEAKNASKNRFYVQSITVYTNSISCAAPTATSKGTTTKNSQVVSWTDGSGSAWDVYHSTSNTAPTTQTTATNLSQKSYTFTGLTPATKYYWWVRTNCGSGSTSSWVAGTAFTTNSITYTDYLTDCATTWDVTIAKNEDTWGTVSQASVTAVADQTTVSASSNVLTIGTTEVAATAAEQTDQYTYAFSNWTGIPGSGKITEDVTITANFTRTARTYNVTYKDQGGADYSGNNAGSLVANYTYGTGATLVAGTKYGFNFEGWYDNSGCTGSPVTTISNSTTGDKTYYAKWSENLSCSWNLQGTFTASQWQLISMSKETGHSAENVAYVTQHINAGNYWFKFYNSNGDYDIGAKIGIHDTNENFTMCSSEETSADLEARVSGDYRFKLDWSTDFNCPTISVYYPAYVTVTFNMNGHGDAIADKYCVPGGKVVQPSDPSAAGWDFAGWYENASCTGDAFDFNTTLSADKTLYAKWIEARTTLYLDPGVWDADNAKFAVYYFGTAGNGWSDLMTIAPCETSIYTTTIPKGYEKVDFVRLSNDATAGTWDKKWNQTSDITLSDSWDKCRITDWGSGDSPYSTSKYSPHTFTVTCAVNPAGYGTVSQANVTSVPCGTSISATGSTLRVGPTAVTASPASPDVQYTYAFDHWDWTDDVTEVTSNITATAHFTHTLNQYTINALELTNCAVAGGSSWPTGKKDYGSSFSTTFVANEGYKLPSEISVTGATYTWSAGTLTITSVIGDVTVSIVAVEKTYVNYRTSCTTVTTVTLAKGDHGTTNGSATIKLGTSTFSSWTGVVAAEHFDLIGYYDGDTKVIDENRTLVSNVTGWTTADGKWDKDATTATLTAKFTQRKYTVTLNDNGIEDSYEVNEGESYTLLELSCESEDFEKVGWTKTAPVNNGWASKPTLAGATVSEGGTYYAVYGEGSGDPNTFVKVTSSAGFESGAKYMVIYKDDDDLYALSGSFSADHYLSQSVTETSAGVITNSTKLYIWTIEGTNSASSFKNEESGKWVGINNEQVCRSTTQVYPFELSWKDSPNSDQLCIIRNGSCESAWGCDYLAASSRDPLNDGFAINYNYAGHYLYKQEGTMSYISNPDCRTITGIEIITPPTKVTYNEEETFNPAGLVIRVTYDEGDPINVPYSGNESSFSFSPDLTTPLTTSDASVRVTYGGFYDDQTIKVNALTRVDVRFYNNGTQVGTTRQVIEGRAIGELPTPSDFSPALVSCDDESTTFVGWSEATIMSTEKQHTSPTIITSADIIDEAKSYNAVWASGTAALGNKSLTKANVGATTQAYTADPVGISSDGYTWTVKAYRESTTSGMIQMRARTHDAGVSYIQLPEFGSNIDYITFSVTSTGTDAGKTEGGAVTNTKLMFQSGATKDETTIAESENTNSTSRTITLPAASAYTTGYITADGGIRVWNVTVHFKGSYDNFMTTCCENKVAAPVVDATKTHNSITLSWSNVAGATGYKVTINGGTHDVTTSSCSYTESGLTPNTAYSWTVVATWNPEGAYCGAIAAIGTTTTNPVYTVTYVKAGSETGSVPIDANTYPQGGSVTVAGMNTLSYSGYDFAGWKCSQDNETYTEGQTVTMGGGNMTFTAVWTPKKDTYFDDIHKTTGYTGDGHIEEGKYTVPTLEDDSGGSNSCETGHSVFVGWVAESYTNPDGTLKPGFTITYGGTENKAAKNIRYHAVWAESGK